MPRFYDLSLPLAPGRPAWPGDPIVDLHPYLNFADDGVRVSRLTLGTHSGTHIDAPAHLLKDGAGIESIAPDLLCGPAMVLDHDAPGHISSAALDVAGIPVDCCRLLLRTSNSVLQRLHQPAFDPDYVALTEDGARWLVDHGVRLVGIDALSVDAYTSADLPAHHELLSHGIVIVEGLDLRLVPAGPYELICAPLLLTGADGAPARVFLRRP